MPLWTSSGTSCSSLRNSFRKLLGQTLIAPLPLPRNQPIRLAKMQSQLIIGNRCQLNPHPAFHSHVRRPIKFLGLIPNQLRLQAFLRRNRHRHMTIVMMVVRKHREHSLAHKKCRLAMRRLFRRSRQRQTNPPHPLDLLAIRLLSRARPGTLRRGPSLFLCQPNKSHFSS